MKENIDAIFELLEGLFGDRFVAIVLLAVATWTTFLPLAFCVFGSFAAGCVIFCVNWLAYVYVCCRYEKESNAC